MEQKKVLRGGEFLVNEVDPKDVFIPEEFNEEQNMIVQTCEDFLETEIFPNLDRLDKMEPGLMREMLRKAGELGLLGISVPEELEGFNQDFLTSMRANEAIGSAYSFSVAFMAHTGIGTLPLLYYGTEEQKRKYIPKLATGEMAACYCLTEPGAGSDANAGKTKAVLSEDGKHYILNGQKMWITNGGFAELQTVFAKIDNDRVLSAFLVEKEYPGVVINAEEKKMGIKGSSTVQIFYNDVKVPVENLLGKRGEGFRIALNILHIGRIKLGGTVIGASKRAITHSVNYANERRQFNHFLSDFGAIKYKLAEQVIKTFATESAIYRVSDNINDTIKSYTEQGFDKGHANIEGISHYAIEAALMKVFGSESLDYVADEAVQIYGGMGFSAESPVDRAYRDSRINRIFEGTNEINRLLALDLTIKRALKGEYPLFEKAEIILNETAGLEEKEISGTYYEVKSEYIRNFKKAVLIVIESSFKHFDKKMEPEQEINTNLADMMIHLYATESTLLRVQKFENIKKPEEMQTYKNILDVLVYDASTAILKSGLDAINSFASGDEQKKLEKALYILTKTGPVDVKAARRQISGKLIEDNRYNF